MTRACQRTHRDRYAAPDTIDQHLHAHDAGDVAVYPSRTTAISVDGTQGNPLGSAGAYMDVAPAHPEGR